MAEKAQKVTKVKLVTTTEDPVAAKLRKERVCWQAEGSISYLHQTPLLWQYGEVIGERE